MGSFETLKVERGDGVVTVTMNRPEKKNAIDAQMTEELIELLTEVKTTESDRVLILTGSSSAADVDRSRQAGAAGFLTKDRIDSQLVVGILALASE